MAAEVLALFSRHVKKCLRDGRSGAQRQRGAAGTGDNEGWGGGAGCGMGGGAGASGKGGALTVLLLSSAVVAQALLSASSTVCQTACAVSVV